MRLIVKKIFRDKTDHVTLYKPGSILEMDDQARASDLIVRGLCAEHKDKSDVSVASAEVVKQAVVKPRVRKS